MLSERSSVDIHALKRQGMTISEIARRTNQDRKTIRAYLNGERTPGKRERSVPDAFEPFVDYVAARLVEDPHLWAMTLFDELVPLGFAGSCPTLTRQIRARGLRPACTACAHVTKRANAVIEHPPGEETQFDWVEMPDPPVRRARSPAARYAPECHRGSDGRSRCPALLGRRAPSPRSASLGRRGRRRRSPS